LAGRADGCWEVGILSVSFQLLSSLHFLPHFFVIARVPSSSFPGLFMLSLALIMNNCGCLCIHKHCLSYRPSLHDNLQSQAQGGKNRGENRTIFAMKRFFGFQALAKIVRN